MFGLLFGFALREQLRAKKLVVWLIVALALWPVALVVQQVSPGQSAESLYNQLSAILLFRFLALASALFSSGVVATEVEQKTIVYLLTRPIDRRLMLVARTLGAIVAAMLVSALAALALSAGVFGLAGALHPQFLRDLPALAIGASAYTGLFVLIGLWIAKGSMLVNLLFAFGWETLVPNMGGEVYRLSLYTYLNAIAQRPQEEGGTLALTALAGQAASRDIEAWLGYAVSGGVAIVAIAAAAYWFWYFEYVPREDAE